MIYLFKKTIRKVENRRGKAVKSKVRIYKRREKIYKGKNIKKQSTKKRK